MLDTASALAPTPAIVVVVSHAAESGERSRMGESREDGECLSCL